MVPLSGLGRLYSIALLLLVGMTLISCASSPDPNLIQNIIVCEYDASYQCDATIPGQQAQPLREFVDPSHMMVTADIDSVPVGRSVVVDWNYLVDSSDRSIQIANVTYERTHSDITSMFAVLKQPDGGWPSGRYEVILYVDGNPAPSIQQPFAIAAVN